MPGILPTSPDSDSEDELPAGWEERATKDGFVYYLRTDDKSTVWSHPRTGKSKRVTGELPPGWRRETDTTSSGPTKQMVFIDGNNGDRRTYADPRLAFAVEDLPKSLAEVRQRFDASTTALQVLHGRDLTDCVAVVTGANSGIGFETARSLAMHGCTVVLACRNLTAGREAVERIARDPASDGASRCRVMYVDLAELATVKRFVEQLIADYPRIDQLILNAAVFALPHTYTVDKLEATFQICHLSHHYIATRLSDRLGPGSRVVVVSSESHRLCVLSYDRAFGVSDTQLSPSPNDYWAMLAYNNAKFCNVLFSRELGRRWKDRGIATYSLHPGNMVSSSLSRYWWFYRLFFALVRPFTKSLQQAAATTIYCATAPELTGISGQYYSNCYLASCSLKAQDEAAGIALFERTEAMIEEVLNEKSKFI